MYGTRDRISVENEVSASEAKSDQVHIRIVLSMSDVFPFQRRCLIATHDSISVRLGGQTANFAFLYCCYNKIKDSNRQRLEPYLPSLLLKQDRITFKRISLFLY